MAKSPPGVVHDGKQGCEEEAELGDVRRPRVHHQQGDRSGAEVPQEDGRAGELLSIWQILVFLFKNEEDI